MSNYYYDEKGAYLSALAEVRQSDHNLTSFLVFALKGIALQSGRLLKQIQKHISKELYRNMMYELFGRLKSQRKRFIAKRQMKILEILLDTDSMDIELGRLGKIIENTYDGLKNPWAGLVRDLINLRDLNAIAITRIGDDKHKIAIRLEWPMEITETEFFAKIKNYPKVKTLSFLG